MEDFPFFGGKRGLLFGLSITSSYKESSKAWTHGGERGGGVDGSGGIKQLRNGKVEKNRIFQM